MALGPLEYLVVGFEGNQFTGQILTELRAAQEISILVVILLGGEKPRRFLQERFQQVRGALPEREQVQQYAQQATTRVSQFAGNAKGTVQQTMKKMKPTGTDLGEQAKQLTPVGNEMLPG